MDIKIKYFADHTPRLEKITIGDWIDLRVIGAKVNGDFKEWNQGKMFYEKGDFIMIQTGVAMKLPKGYEAHVAPRSSTFKKFGLIQTNSVGVIDETYCGDNDQWFIPMLAMRDGNFDLYDRVAQFRIVEKMPDINFIECSNLDAQNRGGDGSTGYK